jgi:hypothetical protein
VFTFPEALTTPIVREIVAALELAKEVVSVEIPLYPGTTRTEPSVDLDRFPFDVALPESVRL